MEESNRIKQMRDADDMRSEAVNPESESIETGGENKDPGKAVRKDDESGYENIHGSADRSTVPLTNRKIEQDKQLREKESEFKKAEEEKHEKQKRREDRQKEWGE